MLQNKVTTHATTLVDRAVAIHIGVCALCSVFAAEWVRTIHSSATQELLQDKTCLFAHSGQRSRNFHDFIIMTDNDDNDWWADRDGWGDWHQNPPDAEVAEEEEEYDDGEDSQPSAKSSAKSSRGSRVE